MIIQGIIWINSGRWNWREKTSFACGTTPPGNCARTSASAKSPRPTQSPSKNSSRSGPSTRGNTTSTGTAHRPRPGRGSPRTHELHQGRAEGHAAIPREHDPGATTVQNAPRRSLHHALSRYRERPKGVALPTIRPQELMAPPAPHRGAWPEGARNPRQIRGAGPVRVLPSPRPRGTLQGRAEGRCGASAHHSAEAYTRAIARVCESLISGATIFFAVIILFPCLISTTIVESWEHIIICRQQTTGAFSRH